MAAITADSIDLNFNGASEHIQLAGPSQVAFIASGSNVRISVSSASN